MPQSDGKNENQGKKTLGYDEYIALCTLGFEAPVEQEMLRWYQQFHQVPGARVRVSLDGAMDRVTWSAGGKWEDFSEPMLHYLQSFPLGPEGVGLVNDALDRFNPEGIGMSIAAVRDVFELGWYIPDRLPLHGLTDWAGFPEPEMLKRWADRYGIGQIENLGASFGSDQIRECCIPVAGEPPQKSLETGLLLFRYLGLPYPPDKILSVLTNSQYSGVAAALWFTPRQVIKVGIRLKDPDTYMVVGCGSELGLDLDKIALFEGVMSSSGASELEIELLGAEEFKLVLHYGG
ncbi:MAG: hypothetical protein HPY50_07395 [Firmicutes bacterium]|nr:hypothetical protein [Bacillota bacterium]